MRSTRLKGGIVGYRFEACTPDHRRSLGRRNSSYWSSYYEFSRWKEIAYGVEREMRPHKEARSASTVRISARNKLRQPGIEPGSIAWKATMLTFTPPTPVALCPLSKANASLTFPKEFTSHFIGLFNSCNLLGVLFPAHDYYACNTQQ